MTLALADPVHFASEEDHVGLTLFPGDGDVSSPDVQWSCIRFKAFRERLAQAEGFSLPEMRGVGGDRPWSDITTTLKPLLDHPDVGGDDLSTADCAAMLPRLQRIIGEWLEKPDEPLLQQHIQDAQQLMVVLRFCVDESVELIFL
ncbi:hypothetical protein [Streptomyces sp. WAC01280]|uniref:hypothetical protein n=1 Tax=Streptomyces sp. WAC01280 TaxID=2487424 RepID=UPI0021AF5905|nr:hypothetical protein [Streptomyces sp. WAC01280]